MSGGIRSALLTGVVGPSPINVVGIFGVKRFFQTFSLVEIKLLVSLKKIQVKLVEGIPRTDLLTMSMEFHSLLNILLISPVRMV